MSMEQSEPYYNYSLNIEEQPELNIEIPMFQYNDFNKHQKKIQSILTISNSQKSKERMEDYFEYTGLKAQYRVHHCTFLDYQQTLDQLKSTSSKNYNGIFCTLVIIQNINKVRNSVDVMSQKMNLMQFKKTNTVQDTMGNSYTSTSGDLSSSISMLIDDKIYTLKQQIEDLYKEHKITPKFIYYDLGLHQSQLNAQKMGFTSVLHKPFHDNILHNLQNVVKSNYIQ